MTTVCRTPDEAYAAGIADGAVDPPISKDQALRIALILAATQAPELRRAS